MWREWKHSTERIGGKYRRGSSVCFFSFSLQLSSFSSVRGDREMSDNQRSPSLWFEASWLQKDSELLKKSRIKTRDKMITITSNGRAGRSCRPQCLRFLSRWYSARYSIVTVWSMMMMLVQREKLTSSWPPANSSVAPLCAAWRSSPLWPPSRTSASSWSVVALVANRCPLHSCRRSRVARVLRDFRGRSARRSSPSSSCVCASRVTRPPPRRHCSPRKKQQLPPSSSASVNHNTFKINVTWCRVFI